MIYYSRTIFRTLVICDVKDKKMQHDASVLLLFI